MIQVVLPLNVLPLNVLPLNMIQAQLKLFVQHQKRTHFMLNKHSVQFAAFIQAQLKLYVQHQIASAMLEAETSADTKDSAGIERVLFAMCSLLL